MRTWHRDVAAALWAERLKLRRSLVPGVTVAVFVVASLIGALFMFVLQDPERARSMGLLGDKAALAGGPATWSAYFALVAQIVSVGGLLVFGLVVVWLFGREFSDRTAKDLLALPTSRSAVVAAKLILASMWGGVLLVVLLLVSLPAGALLGLEGWSGAGLGHGVGLVLAATALTLLLAWTYGLAASMSRGYLPAVGAMFVSLLISQVVAALGYGAWFPWAVPSLVSGAGGDAQGTPGWPSIASVVVVGLVAAGSTMSWWERSDNH